MNDLAIRGGLIYAGSGGEPFAGDIVIRDDRIVAIGSTKERARNDIDADGCMVTPGFIDIHSHYDGQATWSNRLSPSSEHGVTTVVTGNCGVGFAPCAPADWERLIELMEGVEDIPNAVMSAGLPWAWETFDDYLDFLDGRHYDVNIGTQLPHSALRVFVMGQRGAERKPATDADLAAMTRLTTDALRAGALGFASSDTLFHRTARGEPVPTLRAGDRELDAIAGGIREAGRGVIEILVDLDDEPRSIVARLARIQRSSGFGLSFTLAQAGSDPNKWRAILDEVGAVNEAGANLRGQVIGRPIGILLGHDLSYNPFFGCPSYAPLRDMPLAEKVQRLRDPQWRARLLSEQPTASTQPIHAFARTFDRMFKVAEYIDYEPVLENSVAAQAARNGIAPLALVYDWLLEDEGRTMLYVTIGNYVQGTLDHSFEMMSSEHTVFGLGDGGAHYGIICDASWTTHTLTYWGRDRIRGRLELPQLIRKLTREPAEMMGLHDRGRIAVGMKADLNVIDHARLSLFAPHVVNDLPASGKRLTQRADGYVATIVNGRTTYRHGMATEELPGRLIRGGLRASDR